MSLKQDVSVQGPLYLNEQPLALADVLVLQSQTQSVHLLDALHEHHRRSAYADT